MYLTQTWIIYPLKTKKHNRFTIQDMYIYIHCPFETKWGCDINLRQNKQKKAKLCRLSKCFNKALLLEGLGAFHHAKNLAWE